VIVVDASREREKIPAYIAISDLLIKHQFSAPEIYNVDHEMGYLMVEDLGNRTLGEISARDPTRKREIYERLIEMIPDLQSVPQGPFVYEYTVDRLLDELRIFTKWYCTKAHPLSAEESEEFIGVWRDVLVGADKMEGGRVFVHKDLHLDNLTWLDGRKGHARIGILDFQDAKYGSSVYDIVSILEDPRYPVDEEEREALVNRYLRNCGPSQGHAFETLYAVYTVQRCFKILGNIHHLAKGKGKEQFLALEASAQQSILREMGSPLLNGVRNFVSRKNLLS